MGTELFFAGYVLLCTSSMDQTVYTCSGHDTTDQVVYSDLSRADALALLATCQAVTPHYCTISPPEE